MEKILCASLRKNKILFYLSPNILIGNKLSLKEGENIEQYSINYEFRVRFFLSEHILYMKKFGCSLSFFLVFVIYFDTLARLIQA